MSQGADKSTVGVAQPTGGLQIPWQFMQQQKPLGLPSALPPTSTSMPRAPTPFTGANSSSPLLQGFGQGAMAPMQTQAMAPMQTQIHGYAGGGMLKPYVYHEHMGEGIAALGRGKDSKLVHMTSSELQALHNLALATGGRITTNPYTGLPEAGWLSAILPTIAGGVLAATGVGAPVAAGLVAAEEAIRQKDWKAGLAAGLGAYGGAGIGGALAGAGSDAAAAAASKAGETAATNAATSGATTSAANLAAPSAYGDVGDLSSKIAAQGVGNAGVTSAGGFGAAGSGMGTFGTADSSGIASPMAGAAAKKGAYDMAAHGFQENMSNMGQGIGSLDQPGVASSVGSQVGKMGAGMAAAPAIYSAMNPTIPKPPGTEQTQYWVPGQGYSGLYNTQYHMWNPGQWTQTMPGYSAAQGYAPGGPVSPTTPPPPTFGIGALPASQQPLMNYYQGLLRPPTGPSGGAPPPPPPTAMNNYLAGLQNQATHPVTQVPQVPSLPSSGVPPAQGSTPQSGGMMGGMMNGMMNPTSPNYMPPSPYFSNGQWVTPPIADLNNPRNPYGTNPRGSYGAVGGGGRAGGGSVYAKGGIADLGGDGVSDSVPALIDGMHPAKLARGEFVIPARIVSELGNGSSDAGADRLRAMIKKVESGRKKAPMAKDSRAYKHIPI